MSRQHLYELLATIALIAHPRNARVHPEDQLALLANSLRTFGVVKPLVIDEQNQILAGHGIWQACERAGIKQVPVVRISDLTEAQKRAYLLLDNRSAERSHYQEQMLAEELQFLITSDFEVTDTGFSMTDIDFIIGAPNAKEESSKEEEPVELPSGDEIAISRLGDVWHCGAHRLYNGDACQAESYELLLGAERAEMVITDPPYNVKISGHVSTRKGKKRHREFVMAAGELSDSEYVVMMRTTMRHLVRFSADGSIHYHFIDWRHLRHLHDAADGVYTEQKNLVVWDKGQGALGSFYRSAHELVLVFKSGRAPHINNFSLGEKGKEFGKGGKGRYRCNIWRAPGMSSFHRGRAALDLHSTVKPVGLVADAILDCSNRRGLILDPFCGSGTVLLAAERTGRRAAAIELDPLYVDTAIRHRLS